MKRKAPSRFKNRFKTAQLMSRVGTSQKAAPPWTDGVLAGVRTSESLSGRLIEPGADLRGANLRQANLKWAKLEGADLREAKLSGADLSHADLRGANLSEAELVGAILESADLTGADLNKAKLVGAYLHLATIDYVDFRGADLRRADFFFDKGFRVRGLESKKTMTGVRWDDETKWPKDLGPPTREVPLRQGFQPPAP